MPVKLTIIRDPIHNYIPISHLEKALIDHPLFQRLRHITQNGLAHSVYPSNRTSRFLHSLGTMHVGGQMFRYATANTPEEILDDLYQTADQLVRAEASKVYATFRKLTDYLRRIDDPFYRELGLSCRRTGDELKIVLLQSVRIACVMHDLGHFPFSHTVENVMSDFISGVSDSARDGRGLLKMAFTRLEQQPGAGDTHQQLHESIGRALTKHIFSSFSSQEPRDFAHLCFAIAEGIAAPQPTHPLLACLHSIVSGNLDADRCDYVRRDGLASAFEFGDFDLERILHTLRFVKHDGRFELAPTTVALSALESFFLERYRIYRWLVFHPTAVQLDVALSRALTLLLEVACGELKGGTYAEINRALTNARFARLWDSFESEDHYDRFVGCDEPWLTTLLREVQQLMAKPGNSHAETVKELALHVYLDLVLDRAKRLRPVWKRQEDYATFCRGAVATSSTARSEGGDPPQAENLIRIFNGDLLPKLKSLPGDGTVSQMRYLEDQLQARLSKKGHSNVGLLAKQLGFSPYKQTRLLDLDTNDLLNLEDLSTIVRHLEQIWLGDVQFRIYCWFRESTSGSKHRFNLVSGGVPPPLELIATAFAETIKEVVSGTGERRRLVP